MAKQRTAAITAMVPCLPPLLAICLALVICGAILYLTGYQGWSVYVAMFTGAFGDSFGLSETLVRSIPLILCGLAVSISLQASLWNVGAEGQMLLGCLCSGWVALRLGNWPATVVLPLMFIAGFGGGLLWAGIAAFLKSRLEVSEILTTLLLNYVAIELVNYFVYGPWKDRSGGNFPNTPLFAENAWLGSLGWGRLHTGFMVAIGMAGVVYILLRYTTFGFEIRVVGDNVNAARYAGINCPTVILITLMMAGGMAGLAGFVEVAGIEHKLHHHLSQGYGYTAIIIAWLAKKHPLWIIPVAILLAGLTTGSEIVQITHHVPRATANILQGTILLSVLLSDLFQQRLAGVNRILPFAAKGHGCSEM